MPDTRLLSRCEARPPNPPGDLTWRRLWIRSSEHGRRGRVDGGVEDGRMTSAWQPRGSDGPRMAAGPLVDCPRRNCCLQRYKMRRTTFILVCVAIFGWVSPGHAVPVVPSDPPMSAERIARLPSEIRAIVLARCGAGAEAGHYFATYDDNSNVVRLDYSLLQCPNAPEHCESSSCVHTFVRRGGKYLPSHSSGDHSPRQHWRRDLTLQFPSRMHAT